MTSSPDDFQVFVKPVGAQCNLGCMYCYYLEKKDLYPSAGKVLMDELVLRTYIVKHIQASKSDVIFFSWHGGEPTIAGIDYYRRILTIQQQYLPQGKKIVNGIQTNGTLLDDHWARFLAKENFFVGISIDGPPELHDLLRLTANDKPAFARTIKGYRLLRKYGVNCEILCVVNSYNVNYPLEVYRYFKMLGAGYISFLPLVIQDKESATGVNDMSVPAESFGRFLCTIFDEWKSDDIGKVRVQLFEEAAREAFGQEHTLCILKETCGGVPVIEHNGDFYSCDHYVNKEHLIGNINEDSLTELLINERQVAFGRQKLTSLPHCCLNCEVRPMCNGGCMKDRFIETPDGMKGLNYLCAGFKMFFNHCQPFVKELAMIWKQNNI